MALPMLAALSLSSSLDLTTVGNAVAFPILGTKRLSVSLGALTGSGATLAIDGSKNGGSTWVSTGIAVTDYDLATTLTALIEDGDYRLITKGFTHIQLRVGTAGSGPASVIVVPVSRAQETLVINGSSTQTVAGTYNATPPTRTDGQSGALQTDANGKLLVSGSFSASTTDVRATGTVNSATLNATYAVALNGGEGVVGFAIAGLTASGATLSAEASNDGGTTWASINAISPVTSTFSPTAITDGNYRVNGGGHTNVRWRVSTAGTGAVTFASNASAVSSVITLAGPASTGDMSVRASGSFTRPANATAYASGQLVANSTAAGSVVAIPLTVARYNGAISKMLRIYLAKSGTSVTNTSFRVHLYSTAPTVTNGDGGTWLTSGVASYLGPIDVTMDKAFSDGASGYAGPTVGAAPMLKPAAGSQIVYALVEARAAYTPVSGETFTLTVEVVQGLMSRRLLYFGSALGPTLDLNFLLGMDPRVTVARASGASYFDATGTLQIAPANVGRIAYDPVTLACLGLLREDAATNSIRNPRAEGASVGTPGTMPTNWGVSGIGSGLTGQVAGVGTESGIPYLDYRVTGTAASSGAISICLEAGTIPVSAGQSWALSPYCRRVGVSAAGISATQLQLYFGGGVGAVNGNFTLATTGLAAQRNTLVASSSGSVVTPYIVISYASGIAIDFTLRIGAPQLELGAFAASLILPAIGTPAATTRAGETDAATLPDAGSYDVLVQDGAGAEWRTVFGPTLPVTPRTGQVYIKRVRAYRTGVISASQKTIMAVAA